MGALFISAFIDSLPKSRMGTLTAVAAGMMTGCALVLIAESITRTSLNRASVSLGVGLSLMYVLDFICSKFLPVESFHFSGLSGRHAVRVFVMLLSLIIHSVGEGLSLGLAATDSSSTSSLVALSLAAHNIPETAALVMSFRAKGVSFSYAMLLGVASSIAQSIVALPSSHMFSAYRHLIDYGMGASAGCMIYAVFSDILPEAVVTIGRRRSLSVGLFSVAIVIVLDLYAHHNVR
jgi:ZIP family zinc transporter